VFERESLAVYPTTKNLRRAPYSSYRVNHSIKLALDLYTGSKTLLEISAIDALGFTGDTDAMANPCHLKIQAEHYTVAYYSVAYGRKGSQ